jgi:hypothetical protein
MHPSINPPLPLPTSFYFQFFLIWQILLGKKIQNGENSKKNVNNKKFGIKKLKKFVTHDDYIV